MPVDEIFSSIASHMIKGMMVHEQLMNSYEFLGLPGYAALQKYRYLDETTGYIDLCKYKVEHYSKLIQNTGFSDPAIIPEEWFSVSREDVSHGTRRDAMIAALDEWIGWEEETKDLYERCYKDLLDQNDIAFAEYLAGLIKEVEEELTFARNERIHKISINFDMVSIMEEQEAYEKKYTKLLRKLF